MFAQGCFELHTFSTASVQFDEAFNTRQFCDLTDQDGQRQAAEVLTIEKSGELPLCVAYDESTHQLVASERPDAVAEFRLVQRPLGPALGMLAFTPAILVNGLRALPFTVLSPRDALVLGPGLHTYVTERIRPDVGPPSNELLGQRCPFCRIPFSAGTQVATHRCGIAYHHETAESHPDIPHDDRLSCFLKLRVCLSCTQPVTLHEELVWDPATV